MRLSPQDKALLITFTGASLLVLVFFFLGVKPYQDKIPEEFFEIPMIAEEEPLPEEISEKSEDLAQNQSQQITHRSFNSNQAFNESASTVENDEVRKAIEEMQERSIDEIASANEAMLDAHREEMALNMEKRLDETRKEIDAREKARMAKKGNRMSTVSYNLEDRNAIKIPNPVYTCDARGKIVLDIYVNSDGIITKMDYNKSLSSSSNGCLIDQALSYTRLAIFDHSSTMIQAGTITYNFQDE